MGQRSPQHKSNKNLATWDRSDLLPTDRRTVPWQNTTLKGELEGQI